VSENIALRRIFGYKEKAEKNFKMRWFMTRNTH
jgi:hypothetical protein